MRPCNDSDMKRIVLSFFLAVVLLSLLADGPEIIMAEQQIATIPSGEDTRFTELSQSIEKSIETEKENILQLEEQLGDAKRLEAMVDKELNAYNILLSTHGNLLLLPTTEIKDLERARTDHKVTLDGIAGRLKTLSEKRGAIDDLKRQTEERHSLNEQQLDEITTLPAKDGLTKTLRRRLHTLTQLLSTQREILGQILGTYTKRIDQLEKTRHAFIALSDKFDQKIQQRKKQHLFERRGSPLATLGWTSIREELTRLADQIALLFAVNFWFNQVKTIWESGGFLPVTFLVLFVIIQFLLLRLRSKCRLLAQRPFWSGHPWPSLTLELFQRSLLLLGATLFLYIYAQARNLYSTVPLIQVTVYAMSIWLFCRWGLNFLSLWSSRSEPRMSERLVFRLRVLLNTVRIFGIAYLVIQWLLSSTSVILFLARVFFEIGLIVWSVSFWKIFREEPSPPSVTNSRSVSIAGTLIIGLGYTIAVGGFLLEMAGYAQLAVHWYVSWGLTAVVVLWAALFFSVFRQWNVGLAKLPIAEAYGLRETARPVRWLLVRLGWLVWVTALCTCLLVAWGATRTLLVDFVGVLKHPIQVGSIRFSFVGFVYAFLILLFTHAAARLWRQMLRTRILVDSGLETGVQESITTIMVYVLWVVGILVSLTALGFSTTSLTVAFGALGVGLGFGLQNIFNNFVSGLILLFERPVQVGDVVEVNGTWGTITKINVRSTQVQTFDNASLIIPNSEFISKQVTNWSFKDLRLRRIITVGVAYGSDVELVRETLFEIVHKHTRILKDPKPEVLFTDFGDSALIFKLRFWSTIDYFIPTETDIRFEIDRLFRERNIQIPFPQRDIHIRSAVEKAPLGVKSND